MKKVFTWVPEYIWDEVEYIPCPHCGGRGQPDGWNCEPRRVFLEDDVCYMIGFRWACLLYYSYIFEDMDTSIATEERCRCRSPHESAVFGM